MMKKLLSLLLLIPSLLVAANQPKNAQIADGVTFDPNNIIIAQPNGKLMTIPMVWNATNSTISLTGNLSASSITVNSIGGADANGQLLIGGSGGVFLKGNITGTGGAVVTLGNGTITLSTLGARNIIIGNTTVTPDATGNFTIIEGSGVTLIGNNTNKSLTISSSGGSSLFTGLTTAIPDAQSVPSDWSLTGVNGIPAFTTPDADYKVIMKVDGTVADVTFSPVAGEVADNSTVALATVTSGASIRYNTGVDEGATSTPTRASGTVYSTPITITDPVYIKAIAYKDYSIDSAVTGAAYTVAASGPSLVNSTHDQGNVSSATTSGIDTTGANLIVVSVAYYLNAPTLTDSEANTWTPLTVRGSGDYKTILYYCYGPSVDVSHTFDASAGASYPSIQVLAFSGVSSSPFDQENGASATSWTSLSTGSITPTQANTLAIVGLSYDSGSGTISVGSGFTLGPVSATVGGECLGGAIAYKVLSATDALNPAWGSTSSYGQGAASIANFKY